MRDRTADLYNAIVALSQLSYGPKSAKALEIVPTVYGNTHLRPCNMLSMGNRFKGKMQNRDVFLNEMRF